MGGYFPGNWGGREGALGWCKFAEGPPLLSPPPSPHTPHPWALPSQVMKQQAAEMAVKAQKQAEEAAWQRAEADARYADAAGALEASRARAAELEAQLASARQELGRSQEEASVVPLLPLWGEGAGSCLFLFLLSSCVGRGGDACAKNGMR